MTYGPETGIPEGAELSVTELTGELFENYLRKTSSALEADGFAYARIFDISILDEEKQKLQPAAAVSVTIELLDGSPEKEFSVVHFSGEEEHPEKMEVEKDGNMVSFSADSFSAYAIVQGPGVIPGGYGKIATLAELTQMADEGLYIGTTAGFFMKNNSLAGSQDAKTLGIEKIKPEKTYPPAGAAKYYFEAAEGTTDQFYIYCLDASGNKQYVYNIGANTDSDYRNEDYSGGNHLRFVDTREEAVPFKVLVNNNGQFRFNYGSRYWNMWNGAGGNHIAAYTNAGDGGNLFYLWTHDTQFTGDPYELDGKTYGLMNWTGGAAGRAIMAESSNANSLDSLSMTVMAKSTDNNDRLFVPDDSDITEWTFEWAGEADMDKYYLKTSVDGVIKYLRVTSSGLNLVDTPDNNCKLQVVPGSGNHSGEFCLKNGNTTLTYTGDIESGFKVGGQACYEWLRLVELSELTSDYFMPYSATKVSVSDTEHVQNGSRVIVYTRKWNETPLRYDLYAVGPDGTLVRCYENGDTIEWVGPRLNTLLWNFVEYTWEGTNEPNGYYELYNQYSEQYIAPQVSDGQIVSDEVIGINMTGRTNGKYYSSILAWDDDNYSYVGLKADTSAGKVVSCPKEEAADFYFAIVDDLKVDDTLTLVDTVDHVRNGITMKIIDLPNRPTMTNFLGSDDKYTTGIHPEHDLLSTDLKENGYPATKVGNSLIDWFTGSDVREVNHLFLQSTYSATGYYEYDSTKNYASLDKSTNNFKVYNEVGTVDGSGSSKWYWHGQFMPFNDLKAGVFASVNTEVLTTATGETLPESDPHKHEHLYLVQNPNYYNAVEIDASFTQTPSGLDDWGHDIIYEFTGDDDFWLYVDRELVINLGGIHDALSGSVNFKTGEVKVQGKPDTTLYQLFYDNYIGRGHSAEEAQAYVDNLFEEKDGRYIFKEYTTHTMKIFYMERGAGASNLHMRFNLASVRPGHVFLGKELQGVANPKEVFAEFPYQIYYRTDDGVEHRLKQGDALHITAQYKDTTTPLKYKSSIQINGTTYEDVFLLKPGELADIAVPDDAIEYYIVECGVDPNVYESVSVKEDPVLNTSQTGERFNYSLNYKETKDRPRVTYVNTVNSNAIRDLTVTKQLYKEDGTTPISSEEEPTTFTFRLYMATEFDELSAANMVPYCVKNQNGNYCRWDTGGKTFVSLGQGKNDFASLTEEEKQQAVFHTSMNGTISKIPAYYTIEVREVLAGTRFKVVERKSEIPDGFGLQKYVYQSSDYPAGDDGVEGTVAAGTNPHVDVCNLRGFGLRVNKVWSDADYMTSREPVYFGLFREADGGLELIITSDAIRQVRFGEDTAYWYYLMLPDSVTGLDQFRIREVKLTNPVVDSEGIVTSYGQCILLDEGAQINLSGRQKGENSDGSFLYDIHYDAPVYTNDSHLRVDKVTNNRPGIVLRKTDFVGNPLAGASFTLMDGETLIGTFTSDENGLITVAFLSNDKDYTLTETKSPAGYHGLEASAVIRLDNGIVSVSGIEQECYSIQGNSADATPIVTIKNRPLGLEVVKKGVNTDGTMEILSGVPFELHREVTVDHVTSMELDPMSGYENLVSETETGIIPRVDESLHDPEHTRTFYLVEKRAAEGFIKLDEKIKITISETGNVTVADSTMAELTSRTDNDTGKLTYTITVKNIRSGAAVRILKIDQTGQALEGARFSISGTGIEDRDDLESKIPAGGSEAVIYTNPNVPAGVYTLTESRAPNGYNALEGPVMITVTSDTSGTSVNASINGTDITYPYVTQDSQTGVYTIKVMNTTGYELPSTGGHGINLIYLIGTMLTGIAGGGLVMRKRRRDAA